MAAARDFRWIPHVSLPRLRWPWDRTRRRQLLINCILTGLVCAFAAVDYRILFPPEVPDELIGVWRSSAAGYTDRYLQLTDRGVIIGRGQAGDSESYYIETVSTEDTDDGRLVTIMYRRHSDGTRDSLSLLYDASGASLTFANQPKLRWTKSVRG
jgi:hypothetical protein